MHKLSYEKGITAQNSNGIYNNGLNFLKDHLVCYTEECQEIYSSLSQSSHPKESKPRKLLLTGTAHVMIWKC